MNKFQLSLILIIGLFTAQSCKEKGCTYRHSYNYNASAEKDDGSCLYFIDQVDLSMDPILAFQYQNEPQTSTNSPSIGRYTNNLTYANYCTYTIWEDCLLGSSQGGYPNYIRIAGNHRTMAHGDKSFATHWIELGEYPFSYSPNNIEQMNLNEYCISASINGNGYTTSIKPQHNATFEILDVDTMVYSGPNNSYFYPIVGTKAHVRFSCTLYPDMDNYYGYEPFRDSIRLDNVEAIIGLM